MIYAIVDHKGGVGKTTTACALAQGIDARKKGKALLIDADAQGTATKTVYGVTDPVPGLYEVITGNTTADKAIIHTEAGDVLPFSRKLSLLDVELSNAPGRDYYLREAIAPLKGQYTHIIIDTAPGLSLGTVQALTASDACIIPTGSTPEAVESIKLTYKTVETVKKYNNKALEILGALITLYDGRANLTRQYEELIQRLCNAYEIPLLHTRVRRCIAIQEAHALKVNLFDYAPKSNAVKDYTELIKEIKA